MNAEDLKRPGALFEMIAAAGPDGIDSVLAELSDIPPPPPGALSEGLRAMSRGGQQPAQPPVFAGPAAPPGPMPAFPGFRHTQTEGLSAASPEATPRNIGAYL